VSVAGFLFVRVFPVATAVLGACVHSLSAVSVLGYCSFECGVSEGWLFFEPFEFFFCRRDAVRSDELGFEGCEGL
jgi:hypothetical protein